MIFRKCPEVHSAIGQPIKSEDCFESFRGFNREAEKPDEGHLQETISEEYESGGNQCPREWGVLLAGCPLLKEENLAPSMLMFTCWWPGKIEDQRLRGSLEDQAG